MLKFCNEVVKDDDERCLPAATAAGSLPCRSASSHWYKAKMAQTHKQTKKQNVKRNTEMD